MSEPNPPPPNPDPINPNSIPPHPGSNEFVRTKMNTSLSGNDAKQPVKNVGMDSKGSLGVKKKSKKGSNRNKGLTKGMEGVVFEGDEAEDMESKEDGIEASEGETEMGMSSSAQVVTGDGNGSFSESQPHVMTHVSSNTVKVNVGNGTSAENMEVNDTRSSSQWPSLSENVMNGGGKSNVQMGNKSSDTVMLDKYVQNNVSFASAFKGLTRYGNNKLSKVPVRMNEQGNPIIMDIITTSMCEKAYGRASFARVLIEVDATNELVDHVEVCYEKLGRSMNLKVEYTWRLPLWTHCKVFGHEFKNCSGRVANVEDKVERAKDDGVNTTKFGEANKGGEECQEVRRFTRNGASSSRYNGQQSTEFYGNRGGFSNRGKGGYNGRGGMAQRNTNEGNNLRFVPVESSAKKVDDALIMEGKYKGNNMNKGKGIVGGNEKTNNNVKPKKNVNVKNSFDVLAKESVDSVDVGSDEWVQMRSKIDLACELGMEIAESEKIRWSKDLDKYYKDKCNAKAKNKLMEGLRWRVSKLQKDISYGHNNAVMNAKKNADELCKEMMKESDNVGNDWANVISFIVNKPATNTIWSVIQRLILGASVYYIWNERNIRRVEQVYRSEDGVFKCITDCVRLKLMGLNLKHTSEVIKAVKFGRSPSGRISLMIIQVSGSAILFIYLSLMMNDVQGWWSGRGRRWRQAGVMTPPGFGGQWYRRKERERVFDPVK
ncbi:zinc knuckle CX2CX4HX4C [Artemisia annua]|uniref:Zinc knuckle CX2CX4HX4C n=1 Tax=Artemisia annua TaxID=35608 RepID=A0A2U1KVY8_ARTAN|nr:zinc knuckle CX2CX4HX4C [Artemisia annua]